MFFYPSLTGADQKVTLSLEERVCSAVLCEVVALLEKIQWIFLFLNFKVQGKTLLHFSKANKGLP